MSKKVNSESSVKKKRGRPKGSGAGIRMKTTDKLGVRTYPGEDPVIYEYPEKVPDAEKVSPEPQDDLSNHKFPPPRKNPVFRKHWGRFIDNITSRENFHISHLATLEVLCDLYCDYEQLQEFIRVNGRTFKSHSRNGEVIRPYPEVMLLAKTTNMIKDYMKLLGFNLRRNLTNESGAEKDSWE